MLVEMLVSTYIEDHGADDSDNDDMIVNDPDGR